jgi:serine/threonine protein phosphatase PrpC
MKTLEIAFTQHRGKLNRQQQDRMLVNDTIHQESALPITTLTLAANDVLLAVADGVATSAVPCRTSRTVLEELAKAVQEHPEWRQEGFVSARHLRHIQTRLADQLADNPKTYGAATTIAVAHIRSNRAVVLNVGDSRVYHADREGHWQRLSKDHTVLQGLIDRGEASPDQEYASLYNAVEHVLIADHEEGDFAIHRVVATLAPGDTLVLCSDGVHDVLGEKAIWGMFDSGLDVAEQVRVWRDAVWKCGAWDNFSVVIASLD